MSQFIKNIIRSYWTILVIIGLWMLFSAPYFFKGLVPFPSTYLVTFFPPWSASYGMPVKNNAMPDVITQIYPWKQLTIDMWKDGIIPLWNPYSFSGTVHAGNYQSAVFSPFNLLFFILPFIDAWSIFILLQPLLAGLFMLVFLREIGCSKKSSLLGSVGFMFSGFLVTWMAYGTLGYAILFLPIILWSIKKYQKTDSLTAFITGSIAIACSFFSGHFQISVYVLIVAMVYALYEAVQIRNWKKGMMSGFMLIIGVFLSAPQLTVTFDAFQASVRAANTLAKEVIPWQYIVTFLSPDFYGNPVTRNDWFGHYAEWAGYIGVVLLIFSFYGAFFSQNKQKLFFIGTGIVSLLLAYASPLSTVLFIWKVPVLSTSAASRIIIVTSFCLSVLGAFGFDQLLADWKKGNWKLRMPFYIGVFIVLLIVWGAVWGLKMFSVEQLVIAKRNILLPTMMVMGTIGFVGLGYFKKTYFPILAFIAILSLSCFDSYRYASKWMPFEAKEYVYPEQKSISFLQKQIGLNRVYGNIGNEVGSSFQIPLIEGYDAMYQGRYGEFMNASSNGIVSTPGRSVVQFDKHGLHNLAVLQLLNVKYILHRISDGRNIWVFPFWQYPDEFTSIYKDEHYEILEYKNAFPPAFLASSYVVKNDSQEIIDTLFQKDFDRKNAIVLEKNPTIEPETGDGVIEDISYEKNGKVRIQTKNSVPKLLFRSETFDPGWHVSIDKKRVPLHRADYDFQAVAVPEGEHVVEFSYQPVSFQYGFYVFLAGLGGLSGSILYHVGARGKRKRI